MRYFVITSILFFIACQNSNQTHDSFDDLSIAFVKWYYKNNPTEASKKNLNNYHGEYKLNSYKSSEQYLLDLNRFYFELTQINYKKMSKSKKNEYSRLEKIMLKLLYKNENIKPSQWTPIFELCQIEKGLRYLLNYNYLPMKNKIENISSRLDKISQLLDNSLTNLFFISDKDYIQSIRKVDFIIDLLDSIEIYIDYNDPNYLNLVSKSKIVKSKLIKFKKELFGAKTNFIDSDIDYTVNNDSFSIMTEVDVDINSIYNRAISNLKTKQIKLFQSCLPIYLKYEDEPVWAYYEDTLDVIKYVVDLIQDKNSLSDLSYVNMSYEKHIFPKFNLVKFNFYNDFTDISYFDESFDIVVPINLKGNISINLPKMINGDVKYNKINIDLLNAHNIYPGYMYLFYSNNEPFTDLNSNSICDPNENFTDVNSNDQWDGFNRIAKNFPNVSILKGAQRYAERIVIKTNSDFNLEHKILHNRNLIIDIVSCISDIDYHLNNVDSSAIQNLLRQNSFLDDNEILNLINKLESNYFGYLSQKYIGYTKIMELEREYFNFNQDKNYLQFYNTIFKNGIIDYENL